MSIIIIKIRSEKMKYTDGWVIITKKEDNGKQYERFTEVKDSKLKASDFILSSRQIVPRDIDLFIDEQRAYLKDKFVRSNAVIDFLKLRKSKVVK